MKYLHLIILLVLSVAAHGQALLPVVSNVSASQRTDGSKIVDIYYDLTAGDPASSTVALVVSDNNGSSFDLVPDPAFLSGDVGEGVSPGTARHIQWSAGEEGQGYSGYDFVFRVIATNLNSPQVEAPLFSLAEGFYPATQVLSITCSTTGASIYYSVDGSMPTEASIPYDGEIVINTDTTIKARAFIDGLVPSQVVSATYIVSLDATQAYLARVENVTGAEVVDISSVDNDIRFFQGLEVNGHQLPNGESIWDKIYFYWHNKAGWLTETRTGTRYLTRVFDIKTRTVNPENYDYYQTEDNFQPIVDANGNAIFDDNAHFLGAVEEGRDVVRNTSHVNMFAVVIPLNANYPTTRYYYNPTINNDNTSTRCLLGVNITTGVNRVGGRLLDTTVNQALRYAAAPAGRVIGESILISGSLNYETGLAKLYENGVNVATNESYYTGILPDTRSSGVAIGNSPAGSSYPRPAGAMINCMLVIPQELSEEQREAIHAYLLDKFTPEVMNPYGGIDFNQASTLKADFHTHTNYSDGAITPKNRIDTKASYGYKVLAITDHDTIGPKIGTSVTMRPQPTWPWNSIYGNSPEIEPSPETSGQMIEYYPSLDMFAIIGNEFTGFVGDTPSNVSQPQYWGLHHIVSLCNPMWTQEQIDQGYIMPSSYTYGSLGSKVNDTEWRISEPGNHDGLLILAHPQYHWQKFCEGYLGDPPYPGMPEGILPSYDEVAYPNYPYPSRWYADIFTENSHALGIEAFNIRTNGIIRDHRLYWDLVLTKTMPERPVWGFANSDAHNNTTDVGKLMSMLFVNQENPEAIVQALVAGSFYGVYDPQGSTLARHTSNPPAFPTINSITCQDSVISISSNNTSSINWINNQAVIHTGPSFDTSKYAHLKYIRAELTGSEGSMAFTQPFALKTH
mgnify:FL=1